MDGTESERRWGGVPKQDVLVRNPVQFPPSPQKSTKKRLQINLKSFFMLVNVSLIYSPSWLVRNFCWNFLSIATAFFFPL